MLVKFVFFNFSTNKLYNFFTNFSNNILQLQNCSLKKYNLRVALSKTILISSFYSILYQNHQKEAFSWSSVTYLITFFNVLASFQKHLWIMVFIHPKKLNQVLSLLNKYNQSLLQVLLYRENLQLHRRKNLFYLQKFLIVYRFVIKFCFNICANLSSNSITFVQISHHLLSLVD